MEEIWAVERLECIALQEEDSMTLQKIRAVDFIQNYQEDIVVGNKKFPKYSYVARTNKSVWISDGFVFSTGDESVIPLTSELYTGKVMTRKIYPCLGETARRMEIEVKVCFWIKLAEVKTTVFRALFFTRPSVLTTLPEHWPSN